MPGGVAVAELVPDLARAVGLLDPSAVYAGYRLHAHGRRLRPDQGLREQGVDDGALLAVTAGADDRLPVVHDDLAEATAEAVGQLRAWQPPDVRLVALGAGLLALAVGLGALAWDLVPQAAAAVALALVVLAGNALPGLAVAGGVARAHGAPVDRDRLAALVARSTRLLLAGSVTVALVAAATVPVVANGAAGTALAVDCCGVLLLRARRHRASTQVLVDSLGGLAGLMATVLALLVRAPDSRSVIAAALVFAGVVILALARLPAAPTVRLARAADLLETATLVAIAPLLMLVADGLARLTA